MEYSLNQRFVPDRDSQDRKMALMAGGHEIWLGDVQVKGSQVNLSLFYGHNMRQDGVPDPDKITSLVFPPSGPIFKPGISVNGGSLLLGFDAPVAGYYTIIANQGIQVISQIKNGYVLGPRSKFKDVIYAGAFHQIAKRIVAVRKRGVYTTDLAHGILEIIPGSPECEVGDRLMLKARYGGRPLPHAGITVVSGKKKRKLAVLKTDEKGEAAIKIPWDGEWMFLLNHRDPFKKMNQEFDESVFVCTLVMEAI